MQAPLYTDVLRARHVIAPYLAPTPLRNHAALVFSGGNVTAGQLCRALI